MQRRAPDRDGGFTLPETLIALVISGILVSTLTMAFSVVVRSQQPAQDRIAESKDVSFVQTWLPIDLASSKELNKEPDHQPASPPVVLPGTNVVTIRRVDLTSPSAPDIYVAYRYQEATDGSEWQLVRYEIRNFGTPSETVAQVGVAHSLPAPPPGWVEGIDVPDHAVDMTSRNPVVLREAGENITVHFQSGDQFVTGGAGLGPGSVLPDADNPAYADPLSPPSRCGGNVSVIVDNSGSVDDHSTGGVNNGVIVKNEVAKIIDNFVGTPTAVKLYVFNEEGHPLWPDARNAPFISVLNDNADVATLRSKVSNISYGGSTNWEDGLRTALTDGNDYRDNGDVIRTHQATYQPDLLIFVTDGKPNRVTDNKVSKDVDDESDVNRAAQAAQLVANVFKTEGVTMKGVFIGSAAATYLPNLKTAIGPVEWEVTPETAPVGNAITADVFQGQFGDLDDIFRQIFVAECGGTLTVQKRVNGNPPSSGTWTYTTSNGVRDLNVATAPSITFGYNLGASASQWVEVIETPVPGMEYQDMTCTSGVNPLVEPTQIRDLPLIDADNDGSVDDPQPGKEILVSANEAISCIVNSVSTP